MAETIPGAELVVIPDAGHSPQFENWGVAGRARKVPRGDRLRPPPVAACQWRETAGSAGPEFWRAAGGRALLRPAHYDTVFTFQVAHLFPFYDGCVQTDIRLVDVRHEQTATFAAEGWAKVTRRVGVCALTAGPGVTNGGRVDCGAQVSGAQCCARRPGTANDGGLDSLQELEPRADRQVRRKLTPRRLTTEAIPATVDTALRLGQRRTAA